MRLNSRQLLKQAVFLTILGSLLLSCATSPLGRNQLMLNSDLDMDTMGVKAFHQIKKETPITNNVAVQQYVQCIADALLENVESHTNAPWEVQVFNDEAVNAFALPGNKIGIYTGLLQAADTPDRLATVMGHEVAHVLAKHGNERVSQNMVAQYGLAASQIALGSAIEMNSPTGQLAMAALGLGVQVGFLLPYSRTQESEADIMGLDIMAKAGFDPSESVTLWENMATLSQGAPPEFMSTHPSHQTRINQLSAAIPHALMVQEQALASGKRPNCQLSHS